jgi:CSLREA domain-containing protein
MGLFLALLGVGARDLAVLAFGGTDVNLITGAETSPRVTQTESSIWGHGSTVVAVYTDSSGLGLNPPSQCGVSVSTDGGTTFTRLAEKFNAGGGCYGGASVGYSLKTAKWYARFLTDRCGPPSKGVGQWVSPDGINWAFQSCAAVAGPAALQNPVGWINNIPTSAGYGRQIIAFNNPNVNGGWPQVTVSNDDGQTWIPLTGVVNSIQRVVGVLTSRGNDGAIFVQTLDEGGGGLNGIRRNFIHRSDNGGVTFVTLAQQGPSFLGPGRATDATDPYFVGMYTIPVPGYWRDMGWGQPGAGPNNVLHYVYSARTASDPGNIYYVRSNNAGLTWSQPVQLNTDATLRAQWSPSLSVNAQGIVFVSWYDERNTANDFLQRFGRASLDNGLTWESDMALSAVIFPKPLQPDSGLGSTFVGYWHHAAFSDDGLGNDAYHSWTDGRNSINGPQQDVFFHKINFSPPAPLVVTTIDDHNDGTCNAADCTLREAITAANASADADIITFAPGVTGTIQLTGALPNLSRNLTVQGPGANLLSVRRNLGGDYRIFTVSDGDLREGPLVTLSGLTITNGNVTAAFPGNCGGGILNDHATLTVSNCALNTNTAALHGGAIFNYGDSGFAGLTILSSTLSQNGAAASGGGIFVAAYGGQTASSLTNCTLSQNAASQYGGAIYNDGTGSGNAALTLTNCTLNGNTAVLIASGIYNDALNPSTSGVATLRLRNTILRAGDARANLVNDGGAIISDGHNLSSDNGGGFLTAAGDQINTNPLLDVLSDNSGPTKTHALLPGSPAINAGGDALAPKLDQRGYLRVGVSDIGAFELGGTPMRITSIARPPNGHVVLQGLGVASGGHTIQASPDLSADSFVVIGTTTANATGALTYDDAGAVGLTKRFYRLSFP